MTSNSTNLGASSPLPEGGMSLRIPIEKRLTAGFARCKPPLMSNVGRHWKPMDISLLLERLRAVSNDDLRTSLRTQNLSIDAAKFRTAFQCVAASHDLSRPDIDFRGPSDVPEQVIRGGRLRASVIFMAFSALCYMRSEHLERGLDGAPEHSPLRAFRDIYRAGSIKRGEDTLVQHVRNALAHGSFQLGQSPEIKFVDGEWQETLVLAQLMELCEHVHRLYHEAFSEAVPRPPHWSKYGRVPS